MPVKGLDCHASRLAYRDTCPRPATQDLAFAPADGCLPPSPSPRDPAGAKAGGFDFVLLDAKGKIHRAGPEFGPTSGL